jgi:hypothetical protein
MTFEERAAKPATNTKPVCVTALIERLHQLDWTGGAVSPRNPEYPADIKAPHSGARP